MPNTTTCSRCGGQRGQGSGRGMCKRCYNRARRCGELAGKIRRNRPLAETVAEHDRLSSEGLSVAEIAQYLGIKRSSLSSALRRAGRGIGQGHRRPSTSDDGIIDDVAIRRCLAGTFDGRRLTHAEREQAVITLWCRRWSPREIAHCVGISLIDVEPLVARSAPESARDEVPLVPATPGQCANAQADQARKLVAAAARDADDARELLLALGLAEERPELARRATTAA